MRTRLGSHLTDWLWLAGLLQLGYRAQIRFCKPGLAQTGRLVRADWELPSSPSHTGEISNDEVFAPRSSGDVTHMQEDLVEIIFVLLS